MKPHSKTNPSRNALCSCGSGKKRKHCCGAAPAVPESPAPNANAQRGWSRLEVWILGVGLLGFVTITVYAMISVGRNASEESGADAGTEPFTSAPSSAGSSIPEPWEYDAANDRHWDPTHGHWHQGRPPAASGQSASPEASAAGTGTTPEAWEHDAANNRHWDPDHGHWHEGPPPAPALRQ